MAAQHSTLKPRYNRCDSCGRNAHKVAVREGSGPVEGYCPSCWVDYVGYALRTEFANETLRNLGAAHAARLARLTVVYDRRGSR